MPANEALMRWLRDTLAGYELDLAGVLVKAGITPEWPLTAAGPDELVEKLHAGGHLVPLPKEPAALANILEVSLVDYLRAEADRTPGIELTRGTERGYPDFELTGTAFGRGVHAIDVKNARRGKTGRSTQSAITLYTGNTYFRYPTIRWPGTFRPFADYETHVDILGIYTLDEDLPGRITDLELIVQEPWRIASKQRSSNTREYLGAVRRIDDLREGNGAFETEEEFYNFWRAHPFRIGASVQKHLDRFLQDAERD